MTRRSTIEVPPAIPEASHLRSAYLTRKLTSAKIEFHPDEESHIAQVCKDVIFRKMIGIPTSLG